MPDYKPKKRRGTRKNPDGSESTHLMAREYMPGRGWVAFPTLFQNSAPLRDDSQNWLDMTGQPWEAILAEADRRGEAYDFGEDVDAAINFADKGSWKKQYATGGNMPNSNDPKDFNKRKHYFTYSGMRSANGQATPYAEKAIFYPGQNPETGEFEYEAMEEKLNRFNQMIDPVRQAYLQSGRDLTTAEAEAISPGIGALEAEITGWMGNQASMKGNVPSFTGTTEIQSGKGLGAQRDETMWGPMRTSQWYGVQREPMEEAKPTEPISKVGMSGNLGTSQTFTYGPHGKTPIDYSGINRGGKTTGSADDYQYLQGTGEMLKNSTTSAGDIVPLQTTAIKKKFAGGPLDSIPAQNIKQNVALPTELPNVGTSQDISPQAAYIRHLMKAKGVQGFGTDYGTLGSGESGQLDFYTTQLGVPVNTTPIDASSSDVDKNAMDHVKDFVKGKEQGVRKVRATFGLGGQIGAGFAGAAQGIAGSLIPGQLGDMAVQGIGSIHGALDKDIDPTEQAIMGGARAAGAVGTAIATGGSSLAAGADDIGAGLGQVANSQGMDGLGAIANTAGSMAGMALGTPGGQDWLAGLKKQAYGGDIYACGGKMKHADGGFLPNTTVYNGLTHEEGGLPLGKTNNEVEDGEVRWDMDGESYIFSNRF